MSLETGHGPAPAGTGFGWWRAFAARLALPLAVGALLLPEVLHARRPNVVLIMADDLGYRDLGCYGHPLIRTPVLDRLAAEGTRLTGFHSGATVCTPSRMALMTGAYPVRLGWTRGVFGYKMGLDDGMSPEALTIAEIFRSEGYATGISGKWHLGNRPETRPHSQGFGFTYYIALSNNQTKKVRRGDEVIEDPFDNRKLTEQFTAAAIRFIRSSKDQPFFLYLPYSAPHFPVEPHPDWRGRSSYGNYGDVVEELDSRIGELLDVLRELGLEKDTIVVFTSDNGPQPGEASDCFPFRGEKWSALEGGTRVPCIVRWPGAVPAGAESDALVSAMDLLPSLSRACGIDWKGKSRGKPTIDGLDVWDTITGKSGESVRKELLHWHGMEPEPKALRSGDWKLFFDRRDALVGIGTARLTAGQEAKLARYREGLVADQVNPPLLVRLATDPGECADLSGEAPARIGKMEDRARLLIDEIKAAGVLPISKAPKGSTDN